MSEASFVGRIEARGILDAAVERAVKFSSPQFVTVFGPAGMGKTRLLREWVEHFPQRSSFRVVKATPTALLPGEEPEPFGLLASLLRERFGLDEATTPEDALARFRSELTAVFGDRRVAEVAGLLGRYLGLELPESPLLQVLATRPEQETELARAVLCRFFEADAGRLPLVILLDDLQQADDPSLDVLGQLAAEIGEGRIVLCAAARPELSIRRPGWGRGPGSHTRVDLPPLSRAETDAFIRTTLGLEGLAPELLRRATVEAGGNPSLLGQLLRLYQEHGVLVAETGHALFDDARAEFVTLALDPAVGAQARIARLDRAERDLLARAAAFGPVFWTGGIVTLGRLGVDPSDPLAVFAPDPNIDEVRTMLGQLAERGFLVAQPTSTVKGEKEWSFCQEAERTAVLAPLEPEMVRRWSRFAAQWLEGRTPAAPNSEWFERLGVLYREGGDDRRAGQCFLRAGDAAVRRLRHDRARTLFERGLALLDVDDSVRQLDAFHKLGDLCARTGRPQEALAHFGQMLRVAWRLDLPSKGGAAHARLGRLCRGQGDLRRAERHLALAKVLFDVAGDRPGIAAVLDDLGRIHYLRGQYAESIECHRQALALRDELGDLRGRALTLSWMGLARMQGGDFTTAVAHFREALAQSRHSRDAHGIVFSLLDLGRLDREAGRPSAALELLEEARALARQMGERLYECHIGLQIGECHLALGEPARAESEFREVKQTAKQFGAQRLIAEAERGVADARLQVGDALGARAHASASLDAARAMGIPPAEGAALRVLGSAVARGAPGDPDQGGAREIFDRAVELLENVGAELELGRALLAYADYEQETGRGDAAQQLRTQAEAIRRRGETLAASA